MHLNNEIISYLEMCQREGVNLQRGMNFRLNSGYSVILMSVRPSAPYRDQILEEGRVLIYEGHDIPKTREVFNPKEEDQPQFFPSGKLTQNGKFFRAAEQFNKGNKAPEIVRVYEKIKDGIWTDNGFFNLTDAWLENDGLREVFKFRLKVSEEHPQNLGKQVRQEEADFTRIIPSSVKKEVFKRDKGECVQCGAKDDLHFDHIIPFSKGGTSLRPENIQILCARHNLQKRDKIE